MRRLLLIIAVFIVSAIVWMNYAAKHIEQVLLNRHIRESLQPIVFVPINIDALIVIPKFVQIKSEELTSNEALSCMADNIYYEAGFESREGQIAVAQVVLNRLHDSHFPKSICDVIYFKKINPTTGKKVAAFSWTLGRNWRANGKSRKVYRECVILARDVLTKKIHSSIIDSSVKYYHATYITARWDDDHMVVAQIGKHVFYR